MLGYLNGKMFGSKNSLSRSAQAVFRDPTFSTPVTLHTYRPMKMENTVCSETLAYKIQTPGNYPEESIKHSEHAESLKTRICTACSRTSCKIVPLTNLNKYLHNDKSEINLNININYSSVKFQKNATIGEPITAAYASVIYGFIYCT
jgi:hypothetical protein